MMELYGIDPLTRVDLIAAKDARIAELGAELAATSNELFAADMRIAELEADNARLREEFAEMLNDWLDGVPITDEQAEYARKRIKELEG